MKIAIMMRAMDQDSGFRANTEALIDHMLPLNREVSYLLLYRTQKWLGRFASYPNVRELLVRAPHKLLWDQVAVPYRAWKEDADVIFNPKFSVPLLSHCPVAMGLQEPAWWTWPQHYEKLDALYERLMLPRYIHKAAHLFPMSNFILEENRQVLGLPLANATLAYAAADSHFGIIEDVEALAAFRRTYQLPARFILAVTRVDHPGLEGSTSFHGGKNPETTFRAFARIRDSVPHELVYAGRRVREYLLHTEGPEVNLDRVRFLDFVPYEEMPKLYNLAELFVNPAYYEGCPGTLLQAMACGCPMLVSNTGGNADVGSDAAFFADPHDPADFADKMLAVLNNATLRDELRSKSIRKSGYFSWEKTARDILSALSRLARR